MKALILSALIAAAPAFLPRAETAPASPRIPSAVHVPLDRAFVSFRIGTPQWMPEQRFQELLRMFKRHPGVTDEITFFTSFTHPPIPVEEMQRRCTVLAGRIRAAKKLGFRAGINVLSTMGHHEENLPNSLQGAFTQVTDLSGRVSRGSFCPNDPALQVYIRAIYQAVADAAPDYVWVDDDVRLMGHMPVGFTCFCDRCLEIFAAEKGVTYTRASLREAFTQSDPVRAQAVRVQWLDHNRATIARLLRAVERTVHQARPGTPLGFMTGDRFFEGYDFDHWAEDLAGPSHDPVYWRPGGGFYEDSSTPGLVGKSHDVGRQVAFLPPWVQCIESEIENFPYQRLKKAAHITVVEAAAHMGAGCTGAAFNVLSGNDEPLDEFEPLVERIQKARPLFDLLARHLGRARPIGLFAAWNKDQAAAGDFVNNPNSGLTHLGQASPMLELGLPAAYRGEDSAVTLLFPQSVQAMTRAQIESVLSRGVYLDVATLNLLNQMGYGELTGLTAGEPHPVDCIEEFKTHPLNGPFAGRQRDCRQSFYRVSGYQGYELTPTQPGVQSLSRIVDYGQKEVVASSLAIFENRLGGRIAVSGYYPWDHLHSLSKTTQLKNLMRWLSRDRLPAYVSSYHKVNLWVRETPKGGLAIVLLNASFDPARHLQLAARTHSTRGQAYDMHAQARTVRSHPTDGPYRIFDLPNMEPWSVSLVLVNP